MPTEIRRYRAVSVTGIRARRSGSCSTKIIRRMTPSPCGEHPEFVSVILRELLLDYRAQWRQGFL
jgi:hypothetical protein